MPSACAFRRRAAAALALAQMLVAPVGAARALQGSAVVPDTALPDASYARARYTKQVARIPMRDGVHLFTQIYRPRDASATRRYPIVVVRTPFSTGAESDTVFPAAIALDHDMLRDGYIFVQQEVRGRYRSEGTFENVRPLAPTAGADSAVTDERTDAEDSIRWLLANVRGHDGRVGLHGTSYGGFYAAMGALSRHPAIRALSLQAPVTDYWREDFHHNGAFVLTSLWAVPIFGTPRAAPTAAHWWAPAFGAIPDSAMPNDYRWLLARGSLRNVDWLANDAWWQSLVTHPDNDAFWQARALLPRLSGLTVPTMIVGGWFDAENLYGSIAAQRAVQARSPQAPLLFVMGPFGHRQWSEQDGAGTFHGALYFGDSIAIRYQRDVEARFFRAHLKGSGAAPVNGARVFDTGRHVWQQFPRWPAPTSTAAAFTLESNGALVPRDGAPSRARVSTRSWTSDPRSPVPARCDGSTVEEGAPNLVMSDNQRCLVERADVLTFSTAPLRRDLTLAGPITATLRFATTGTDADLVVKVIDVYPPDAPDAPVQRDTSAHLANYHQLVRGEILRGRYRVSEARPTPFTPGVATTVTVSLPDVFHTIRAGHRLMVQVQSSWFPLFDRNPQQFVPNIFTAQDSDFVAQTHTIWLGGANGSRLSLRVLR